MIYNVKESGRRIKELRKQKGYTQESFADDIGISVRTYSGIESGAHSTSIDTFVEIAGKLNVSLDYVILGQRENNLSIKIKKEEREIIKKFLYNIIQGIQATHMIRSEYVSNHIKNKKKIKYSYIVIKKRAHLLVEILMKEGNIYVKDF